MIRAVLACDENWGIGKDGTLPWPHNSADLQWFKKMTVRHIVVMGRNTWESLPNKPLPKRKNIVVSNSMQPQNNVEVVPTHIYKSRLATLSRTEAVCIIGGAQLVNKSLDIIDEIWLSRIEGTYNCDTFLPGNAILEQFELDSVGPETDVYIEKWIRK